MKTFSQYLTENKKVYNFKIKVAGDLPENFIKDLKTRMDKCKVVTLDESSTIPVQSLPIDFPELVIACSGSIRFTFSNINAH